MYTIHTYAHSYRTRKTSNGDVIDVVFRVFDETGYEHQKRLAGFANKRLADKAFTQYVAKNCVFKEKEETFKKKYIKFDEAAKNYLAYSQTSVDAATTIKRRGYFEKHYMPYFAGKSIENIKPSDVYLWFDTIRQKKEGYSSGNYAPATLKAIWGQLNTFFEWCSERYLIKNPMRGLKSRIKKIEKEIHFWTQEEFNLFIEKVDDIRWKTFFLFQYYTGCRIGETLALTEKDYNGEAVKITKSLSKKNLKSERYEIKSTKNKKTRSVPVPKILQTQLAEYFEWKRQNGISNKFLFNGADGDYLPHSNIRRAFDLYTAAADLERIRVHDLRHSYVSLLIHVGANLAVIAGLIGDTLEQVTKTYGHMYERDKISVINLLN